jgi:hypothetical protein
MKGLDGPQRRILGQCLHQEFAVGFGLRWAAHGLPAGDQKFRKGLGQRLRNPQCDRSILWFK